LLKGTQVDGVYSADPKKVAGAERYERLSFQEVLSRDLRVMDTSAVALARDNAIPIIVFSMYSPGAFASAVCGTGTFTIIR
jgi:uridylate kinase